MRSLLFHRIKISHDGGMIESKAKNLVDSKELKRVPLERTKAARKAVPMLGYLVDTFGFIRPGMAYWIADPKEGWGVEVTHALNQLYSDFSSNVSTLDKLIISDLLISCFF